MATIARRSTAAKFGPSSLRSQIPDVARFVFLEAVKRDLAQRISENDFAAVRRTRSFYSSIDFFEKIYFEV